MKRILLVLLALFFWTNVAVAQIIVGNSVSASNSTIDNSNINSVFNPMQPNYGAKGDVRHCNYDDSLIGGQATLSSTSAAFTNADKGKTIIVYGAGAAGNLTAFPADGTIGTYTLSSGAMSVTFNTAPASSLVINVYYESGSTWYSEAYGTGDGVTKTFAHTAAHTPVVANTITVTAGPVDLVDLGPADLVTTISSVAAGVATLAATGTTTVSNGLCAFGTDDSAAFASAITAASTAGSQQPNAGSAFANGNSVLRLPPGKEFMIASGLTINANNFTLDGQGASIWYSGNGNLFSLGGATITREYNINNLYVFENTSAVTMATLNRVSRAYFNNIRDAFGQAGIVTDQAAVNNFNIQVTGGRFNQKLVGVQFGGGCNACNIWGTIIDSPADRGIVLGNSSGGQTTGNVISGVTIDGSNTTAAGIDVGSAHGVDIGGYYWEAAANGGGIGIRFGQEVMTGQNNTDSIAIHGGFFNCHSTVNNAIWDQSNAAGAATVADVDIRGVKFTTCNNGVAIDAANTSVTSASWVIGPNLYTSMNTGNYTFQANPIIFDGGFGADNANGFITQKGFSNINRASAGVTAAQYQENGTTCTGILNGGRITSQCGNVLVSNGASFSGTMLPTITGSGGTCGSGDTLDTGSTNMAGGFTSGSGTVSSCVITWGSGHGAGYPSATVSCMVDNTTDGLTPVHAENNTALTVTTALASKHFTYFCVGH